MTDDDTSTRGLTMETAPSRWHRTATLADGTRVGHVGSLQFILDEAGRPVSRGYHEIRVEDGDYVGQIGARRERIRIPSGSGRGGQSQGTRREPETRYYDR